MSPSPLMSSPRRCAIAGALAILLLAAPLWVPGLHLDDPTATFERVEVVVDEEDGITYANESTPLGTERMSDRLGCVSSLQDYRLCAYERHLRDGATVSSGWYTTNADGEIDDHWARYSFVQLNGTTYETATAANESATNEDGYYRVELRLEEVPPEHVLETISRDASGELPDVDPVIAEAAMEGSATTQRSVDVPATVFEVGEDSYYRVYLADESEPAATGGALSVLLYWGLPLLGVGILLQLRQYVEVQYAGGRSN